jgi:hypothetical protein
MVSRSGRSSRSIRMGIKEALRTAATEGLEKESWVVRWQTGREGGVG